MRNHFTTIKRGMAGWIGFSIALCLANGGVQAAGQANQAPPTKATLAEQITRGEAEVHAHPADFETIYRYLNIVQQARYKGDKTDINWLKTTVKLHRAVDNFFVADRLRQIAPEVAGFFYERSLRIPYTPQDKQWPQSILHRWSITPFMFDEPWLRHATRRALVECYLSIKQPGKAQQMLEQSFPPDANGIPASLGSLAGEVEAASGKHTFERSLRMAEAKNTASYAYWMMRGDYFLARKAKDETVQAYETALALTKQPGLEKTYRIEAMTALHHALFVLEGEASAVHWLLQELANAPAGSEYARYLIQALMYFEKDNTRYLLPDNEQIWASLAARPKWDNNERLLLARLAEHTTSEAELQALWLRVVKLTANADTSRADVLKEAKMLYNLHHH